MLLITDSCTVYPGSCLLQCFLHFLTCIWGQRQMQGRLQPEPTYNCEMTRFVGQRGGVRRKGWKWQFRSWHYIALHFLTFVISIGDIGDKYRWQRWRATIWWSLQEGEQPRPLPGPSLLFLWFEAEINQNLWEWLSHSHPSVVKSSLSCLRLSSGQCPYVHIWHLTTTVPSLLANFVSKLLSSVFALKIHLNRDNKRNSLFRRFEWRFQENLGDHLRRNIQDKSRVTYTRILKWTLSPPSVPPARKLQLLTKCSYGHKAAPFSSVHNVTEVG